VPRQYIQQALNKQNTVLFRDSKLVAIGGFSKTAPLMGCFCFEKKWGMASMTFYELPCAYLPVFTSRDFLKT
jgi:hypothetical protein